MRKRKYAGSIGDHKSVKGAPPQKTREKGKPNSGQKKNLVVMMEGEEQRSQRGALAEATDGGGRKRGYVGDSEGREGGRLNTQPERRRKKKKRKKALRILKNQSFDFKKKKRENLTQNLEKRKKDSGGRKNASTKRKRASALLMEGGGSPS